MSKEVILVLFAVFILVFGTYISGTILTPYAESLGATWLTIGVLSGSMYIVRLLIGTPIGILADKKGTVNVLKYSLMLYPLIAIAYGVSNNILSLVGARLLHGVASAMMLPMAMAYIGESSPLGKEGRYMGIYNTIIFFASGFGPLVATVIASYFSYRATFLTLFALAVVALVTVLSSKKADNKVKTTEKETIDNSQVLKIMRFKNTGLLALSSINIALAVISSLVGFFFIAFPLNRGISLIATGFVLAVYNLFSGLIQVPLGKLSDKGNKFVMIIIAGIITTITLFVIPFTYKVEIMTFLMLVIALGSAIILSSSSALSTVIGREIGMGSTMGFLGTANSLGMIIGSLLLGLLPDRYGIDSVFYLCSSSTFVCTLIFSVLWTRYNRKYKA